MQSSSSLLSEEKERQFDGIAGYLIPCLIQRTIYHMVKGKSNVVLV